MERERLESILSDLKNKPNKDLLEAEEFLFGEFEKTKNLIVDLTRHIDTIEEFHIKVTNELIERKSL